MAGKPPKDEFSKEKEMKVKSRSLYLKNGKEVTRHSFATNRRFLARLRAYSGDSFCVLVKYEDKNKEYRLTPYNNSGWYSDKEELLETAKAFLEE